MTLANRLIRSGFQSGSIMMASDVVTQMMEHQRKSSALPTPTTVDEEAQSNLPFSGLFSEIDTYRAAKWCACGALIHGPYFYLAFSTVDSYWGPAKSLANVLKKTVVIQVTAFPYLVLLFTFLGKLEGLASSELLEKVYRRSTEAFVASFFYWPVAQTLNFTFVPPTMRVPFSASCLLPWSCFLSWRNEVRQQKEQQPNPAPAKE